MSGSAPKRYSIRSGTVRLVPVSKDAHHQGKVTAFPPTSLTSSNRPSPNRRATSPSKL